MQQNTQNEHEEFAAEYGNVKKDVKKVIITNTLILALLFALYFVNQKMGWIAALGKLFVK